MRNIEIKETEKGTTITIDGIRLEGLYGFTIQKTEDGPIEVELSGAITKKVLVEC